MAPREGFSTPGASKQPSLKALVTRRQAKAPLLMVARHLGSRTWSMYICRIYVHMHVPLQSVADAAGPFGFFDCRWVTVHCLFRYCRHPHRPMARRVCHQQACRDKVQNTHVSRTGRQPSHFVGHGPISAERTGLDSTKPN